MLLSLDYFLSCFLSFSPSSLGFLPLTLLLPLLSLLQVVWPIAFSICPFPGVSRDDMDCVLVPSSAFIREGEKKREKKPQTPGSLLEDNTQVGQHGSCFPCTLPYCLPWRRDYLGCSNGTSLSGLQPFGRADLASLGGREGVWWGGRHRGIPFPLP